MLYILLKRNPSNSVHNWMLNLFGNLILCSFQIHHMCYSSVSLKGFLKPNQKISIWFECHHLILSLRVVNILFNIGFLNDFLATLKFCSVQFNSVAQSCLTLWDPWTAARQASQSITNSRNLLKLMSIASVMPSNYLILCHPFLLPPSIFASIRVFPMSWFFASGGQSIGVSVSASVLPMNLQDWFPLGLLVWSPYCPRDSQDLLQHHSLKASILWHSAFFIVQLSHPYVTTGKTIALMRWIFVGKVISLLFNMLSRLVITFLPRSKCLLISWLQSPSAVILDPKKMKSTTVSNVSPTISYEVMRPAAMIFVFWMLSFKPAFFILLFHFHQEAL